MANPPDILLTNYVMLELILTRPEELNLIQSAKGLRFLVLDELHTYRGRQGSDVAMLVRRVRDRFEANRLQCVGTSATLASAGTFEEQRAEIARVASNIFGSEVRPENVIGETLRRATPDRDLNDPAFLGELTRRLSDPDRQPSDQLSGFRRRSAVDLDRIDRSACGPRTEPIGSSALDRGASRARTVLPPNCRQ